MFACCALPAVESGRPPRAETPREAWGRRHWFDPDAFIRENETLWDMVRQAREAHTPTLGAAGSIAECANLAVAHTGSMWLRDEMLPLSVKYAHHSHQYAIPALYEGGARCFVMTLRDPAARLVSGFNFDYKRFRPRALIWANFGAGSPNEFVARLRRTLNATRCAIRGGGHPRESASPATRRDGVSFSAAELAVLRRWEVSRRGVGNPVFDASRGPWVDGNRSFRPDGFYSLLPQAHYVKGDFSVFGSFTTVIGVASQLGPICDFRVIICSPPDDRPPRRLKRFANESGCGCLRIFGSRLQTTRPSANV